MHTDTHAHRHTPRDPDKKRRGLMVDLHLKRLLQEWVSGKGDRCVCSTYSDVCVCVCVVPAVVSVSLSPMGDQRSVEE